MLKILFYNYEAWQKSLKSRQLFYCFIIFCLTLHVNCYEKEEHLHCMAFRKVFSRTHDPKMESKSEEIGPDLLYIPQDSNDIALEQVNACENRVERKNELNETNISDDFMNLPLFSDD